MKQYEFSETFNRDPFFNIERIQDNPAHESPRKFDFHSHDYYVIQILTKGSGTHTIDFRSYDMNPGSVFFLNPGQPHQVTETSPNEGFIISFNYEFLARSNISLNFIHDINLFRPFGESPPLHPGSDNFDKILAYCMEIESCFERSDDFRYEALGAYLRLLLISCNASCDIRELPPEDLADNAVETIRNFRALVEKQFRDWHRASQYADALYISVNYLNKLVKTYLGTSTKDYIQDRIILEVKRSLINSGQTAKEIAYDLGYKEPSHLSNAFKKCTGISLSDFREHYQS
ncbi:helix-turn-helix domain-containing protein [Robertkochia solimangrovi]|uniref:helix-turn-helix domain-containing protein n=1 Tax=Robertkochia solimangrovi TaxID=2213046 RepID=UPI0011800EFB|nr:AraC family transcriptional regulator [Robertkochia solimangrovi]TRZ41427.1 hypothetical protein DMZ48_17230 [Robertkochia solimangrovi]